MHAFDYKFCFVEQIQQLQNDVAALSHKVDAFFSCCSTIVEADHWCYADIGCAPPVVPTQSAESIEFQMPQPPFLLKVFAFVLRLSMNTSPTAL